jgi:hypothetical protein
MGWKTYYLRWADMYRQRLSPLEWAKAGFELPFIPEYYKAMIQTLLAAAITPFSRAFKQHLPRAYQVYRAARPRRQ